MTRPGYITFDPGCKSYATEENAHRAYTKTFDHVAADDRPRYLVAVQDGRHYVVLRMDGKNPGRYLTTGFILIN